MAVYDRDYLTTLPLLYDRANEYSNGDWNKYNDDVGDTMLKLLASASHATDYYFRTFLNNLFLPNDDWNMKSLVWELTGYKPNYLRADYLMVQLYWPDCGLNSYVPLYQYTPFKIEADGKEYVFLCAEDYFIPPRTTRFNVRLVNGELVTQEIDTTQQTDYKIKLTDNDIDYDLVTVKVSGEKWTQVRNVFYSPDTARIYSLHKEEDGTYLYLHSTWKEYVDEYDPSFMIYFVESLFDFDMYTDDCMTVTFETELLTLDGEDVAEYYKIIPLLNSDDALGDNVLLPSTTEGNRAITTLDFETNAKLFPGIVCAKSYDWNTTAVTNTPFEVVVIACDKQGNLSEHMKIVLKSYLESICSPLITVRLDVPKLVAQNMAVVLDIGDYRGTLAELQIKRLAEAAVKEFYTLGNLEPGRVVKTKELNSVIMHADSRIYFASTTFLNKLPRSPYVIPILGDLIVITSATTFNVYEWSFGTDQLFIENYMIEKCVFSDSIRDLVMIYRENAHPNELAPVDKLPLEVFEMGNLVFSSPTFSLGANDSVITDFGFGEDYSRVYKFGGSEAEGEILNFIFETDGNSIFGKVALNVTNQCAAELVFTNPYGDVPVPITLTLSLETDYISEIKEELATALNTLPGLIDKNGYPFELTASDIYYEDNVLGAAKAHVTPLAVDADLDGDVKVTRIVGESVEPPSDNTESLLTYDSAVSQERKNIQKIGGRGDIPEDVFVYVPYQAKEVAWIKKMDFGIKTIVYEDKSIYRDVHTSETHKLVGSYIPGGSQAFGQFVLRSEVSCDRKVTTDYYMMNKPSVFSELETYQQRYFISEKNGTILNWYLVTTDYLHDVTETCFIGKGIYVIFDLLADCSCYVTTDVPTTRGFIYSSELLIEQLSVIDDLENAY